MKVKKYDEFVNEGFFDWFKPKKKEAVTNVEDGRINELIQVLELMLDAESLQYHTEAGKTRYYYVHVDANPDEGELHIVINPAETLKLYINNFGVKCSQGVIKKLYDLFDANKDVATEVDADNNPWDVERSLATKSPN